MTARQAGLVPLDAFHEVHAPTHSARRLQALRSVAPQWKKDFLRGRPVIAVRTFETSKAPYPVTYGFNRACRLPYPFLVFQNRALLVQFWQRDTPRLLLMNPTIPSRSARTPYFARLQDVLPGSQFIQERLLSAEPVHLQLERAGVDPARIDYVAFDHQHTQDARPFLGAPGVTALYPNARFLVQVADWEASVDPHPLQQTWFCPDAARDADTDRLVLLTGDTVLGDGCVLLFTPGHTWGNQSLLFRAPDTGCHTVSENGVCMDSYAPLHSRIPGLADHARRTGEEVIMNGNTLEGALDQYNSMVKERLLADPYGPDPRFVQHFASSELIHTPLAPLLRPTHAIGAVNEGSLLPAAQASHAAAAR